MPEMLEQLDLFDWHSFADSQRPDQSIGFVRQYLFRRWSKRNGVRWWTRLTEEKRTYYHLISNRTLGIWPTPQANEPMDWQKVRYTVEHGSRMPTTNGVHQRGLFLGETVMYFMLKADPTLQLKGRLLNPDWVEKMMGLPADWTKV